MNKTGHAPLNKDDCRVGSYHLYNFFYPSLPEMPKKKEKITSLSQNLKFFDNFDLLKFVKFFKIADFQFWNCFYPFFHVCNISGGENSLE